MKKTIVVTLIAIGATAIGCKPNLNAPSPPAPNPACALLGVYGYICGNDSPGNLIFDGKGALQINVVSTNLPQFSQMVTYRSNSWSSPAVVLQNGTGSSNYHQIIPSSSGTPSQVKFDVPMSDDFTITAFYSEYGISAPAYAQTGNLSTCLNPPQNSEKCFRYMWTITLDQGTVPSCNGTVNGQPFVIVINQFENPNILYNDCI